MIYGSSQTNPNYANYQGRQTYNYNPFNTQGINVPPITSSAQTTSGTIGSTPTPTPAPTPSGPTPEQIAQQQREAQVRNDINTGYDAYFSSLDQMLGNLPNQQSNQNQIVENNYNQGVSDLGTQKDLGMADLGTQRRKNQEGQVKTLQDISDNIRNLFQAGNVMLGTRGAGDSSAANQYSYAVTKLRSKQRGDVLSQTRSIENDIADRETRLNTIVTQETGKLKTNRDNRILQIAQWFQDAQNQLLQAKAQGQLQKGQSLASLSTQLLQQAQQALLQADANYKNQQNSLLTWAENNSKSVNELKNNLSQIGSYAAPGILNNRISGTPQFDAQGNLSAYYGGAGGSSSQYDLFGNKIR